LTGARRPARQLTRFQIMEVLSAWASPAISMTGSGRVFARILKGNRGCPQNTREQPDPLWRRNSGWFNRADLTPDPDRSGGSDPNFTSCRSGPDPGAACSAKRMTIGKTVAVRSCSASFGVIVIVSPPATGAVDRAMMRLAPPSASSASSMALVKSMTRTEKRVAIIFRDDDGAVGGRIFPALLLWVWPWTAHAWGRMVVIAVCKVGHVSRTSSIKEVHARVKSPSENTWQETAGNALRDATMSADGFLGGLPA